MDSAEGLKPTFELISYIVAVIENVFFQIPGSHVIARYVRSSHQNDPGRTLLELILAAFAIGTLLQSRTRADNKNLVKLSEKVCCFTFVSLYGGSGAHLLFYRKSMNS